MANEQPLPHPFKVIVRTCTRQPERVRWEVHENGVLREFSDDSYATEAKASAEGHCAMERCIAHWQIGR
jgi:hypothetical protein